jgi:hypothetical protein
LVQPALNGLVYLDFLQNILPILLEEIDLHRRQNMWFQQDGAPPHFHRDVRRYLDTVYANKWIGRGSINPWPPRSPDMTPLDYFIWGTVKERVYQTPINSREDLEHRITLACRSITLVKEVVGSILNISLINSLNFYVLFVIKRFLRWYFSYFCLCQKMTMIIMIDSHRG